MKSWLKTAGLAAVVLGTSTAIAADHGDGPGVAAAPEADINDVYAFISDDDPDKLVLVMTVMPFAGADAEFSTAVQYAFHVNATDTFLGTPAITTDIVCTFDDAQDVLCRVGDEGPMVQGDASSANGLANEDGDVRVFAGLRRDPFFFYLDGFLAARNAVLGAAGALNGANNISPSGCPEVDGVTSANLVAALNGNGGVDAENNFETSNVLALVVEIDKSLVSDDDNPLVAAWASTHTAPADG